MLRLVAETSVPACNSLPLPFSSKITPRFPEVTDILREERELRGHT